MSYYERLRKEVGSWFSGAADSLSVAASNLAKRWQQDAVRWHAARDKESLDTAGGIFGGTTTLGTPAAYDEYVTVHRSLSKGGLSLSFHCPRCAQPRVMSVDWLELAAICVDAPPQLFPGRLRAAWNLAEPSEWWKAAAGGWSPMGFTCDCGQGNGLCEYEYGGGVTTGTFHGLPKLYPAEVRRHLFAALNENLLPRWFVPAAALYAGVAVPHAAADRAKARLKRVRERASRLGHAIDRRFGRLWEKWEK